MPDLLLELFSEEIPARMQARAAEDLKRLVTQGLVDRGLTYEGAAAHAGPRRLVLDLRGLAGETPTRREERKGPRADAAPAAVEGFLRATGLTREQLEVRADRKGDLLFAVIEIPGRPAAEVIAEVVTDVVRAFPWPKSMRWGSGSLRWVRPLQSILCVMTDEAGSTAIPFEIDGVKAGALTRGHRVHAPEPFAPRGFDDYAAKLEAAHVVVDAAERARRIETDARTLAFAQGCELVEDAGLLAEVAGLVEWPVCLIGDIGEAFMGLPPEVLRTSMKTHQKFFSVRNPATGRIEKFITVANVAAADGGAAILHGNRRVLTARLSDARFFWENDLATPLDAMREKLRAVTFHSKLGSQWDRIERIAALAREIAPKVGADPDTAERAARLAKADLASAMVGEFPELQGVMGRYYALAAGEAPEVAAACAEHYAPLGPSDAVPTAPVSVAVALADKLDMLGGFWATFSFPTGSTDPFALRRAALGVVRIVIENKVRIDLYRIIESAARRTIIASLNVGPAETAYQKGLIIQKYSDVIAKILSSEFTSFEASGAIRRRVEPVTSVLASDWEAAEKTQILQLHEIEVTEDIKRFLFERLRVIQRDSRARHDVFEAGVAVRGIDDLVLLVARVEALQAFLATPDGGNLLQGYRRAVNILTAEEKKDGVEYSLDPDPKFAESDPERALFAALDAAEAALDAALPAEDFGSAMAALAALRPAVDGFFEGVLVNAENGILRRNRLCLLHRVRQTMARVADFGALEG